MDDQVFTLLNDKIEAVDKKVEGIAADVKELLAFKWQVYGGSIVCGFIAGVIGALLGLALK